MLDEVRRTLIDDRFGTDLHSVDQIFGFIAFHLRLHHLWPCLISTTGLHAMPIANPWR